MPHGPNNAAFCDEARAFLATNPGITRVDAIFADVNGIIRGKQIPADYLEKIGSSGVNFPLSTCILDSQGHHVEVALGPGRAGDPDRPFFPVSGTLKAVPWADGKSAQVIVTGGDGTDGLYCDPRQVLARALQPLATMGLCPVVAIELEFYLFEADKLPPEPVAPQDGRPRLEGPQCQNPEVLDDFSDFIRELETAAAVQDIPVTSIVCEYGHGQFEANLNHGDDPLRACDEAVMLKRLIRALARKRGLIASFMAKPRTGFTGNGLHIHMSLLDTDMRNIFAGVAGDDKLRNAVGGVLATMPASIGLLAPNANSYRRFQPDQFAPLGPLWGHNHRAVSVRVPLSGEESRRLEHRVAGADCCPYLAMAVLAAAVHFGLERKSDPGPSVDEGASPPEVPSYPHRWREALDRLAAEDVFSRYLGKEFIGAYLRLKYDEEQRFHAEVSDRDYGWYLRVM